MSREQLVRGPGLVLLLALSYLLGRLVVSRTVAGHWGISPELAAHGAAVAAVQWLALWAWRGWRA